MKSYKNIRVESGAARIINALGEAFICFLVNNTIAADKVAEMYSRAQTHYGKAIDVSKDMGIVLSKHYLAVIALLSVYGEFEVEHLLPDPVIKALSTKLFDCIDGVIYAKYEEV